jgi:DNA-binding transcriptional ArsR family regulator
MTTHGRSEPERNSSLLVQIEVSLVYEFFLSLCVFCDRDNPWQPYEIGQSWFEAIRTKLSPVLLATIESFGFQSPHLREALVVLGSTCPLPRDLPTLLVYLRTMDPLELSLHLLGYYAHQHLRPTPAAVIFAAVQGDEEAQAKLLRTSFPEDERWQRTLRWLFSLQAAAVKERLLDLVQGWYDDVFREQEPHLLPILERESETKRALQAMHSPEQVIEMCSGWEYVQEPGIQRVVLIPSYVTRPVNGEAEHGETRLFFYPVAAGSLLAEAGAPPAHVLRLAKALGDERRLRLLKMLAGGSYTLQELADTFGVAKTTIHHHLLQLRSAGLVRMRRSDNRFSLRSYPIDHLGEWIRTYLNGPSEEA